MRAVACLLIGSLCAACAEPATDHERPPRNPRPVSPSPPVAQVREMRAGYARLAAITLTPSPDPLAQWSDAELDRLLLHDKNKLGCASLGRANRGALLNGAVMPPSGLWHVIDPERSWGTPATIAALGRAIERVCRSHPGTPRIHIGDLSRRRGGHLRPHRSHQSGRDADIGYYYRGEEAWYLKATQDNLDVERTWALVEALVSEGDVEYIFMDRSVQTLVRDYAETQGEDPAWLVQLFGPTKKHLPGPIIRHTWGHRTHMHVRFHDNRARAKSRRLYPRLKAHRML